MKIARGRAEGAITETRDQTFVGTVLLDPIIPPEDGITINTVCFQPGAHTFWHSHERGQILQVTAGEGYVCTAGEQPRVIRSGDTIWVPPGERHWHGARPGTFMVHTATSLGVTQWEAPLAESEYPVA